MAQPTAGNHAQRGNYKQYARMTLLNSQRHVVPTVVLNQSKLVPITAVRLVTTTVPKTNVTRARQAKTVITKTNSPPSRYINRSSSPKASTFPPKVTAVKAPMVNVVKGVQEIWEWKSKCPILDHGNPQHALKDKGVIDSGYSRHMRGNMSYLSDFEELNGGYVAFGGNLEKNIVLFTNTECLVLSLEFKMPDENQVLLRVPRENNMYNVDLKNIVPSRDLTCLFAKATLDESNLWHKRLGHINFKTMNKLVKGNLVRGLPSKVLKNDHTCVACKKDKQHRASCKTKPVNAVNQPLQRLYMDLFGPTFVKSLNKKSYCLVVTDNYSRSDNGTEFKNHDLNQFCRMNRIKRKFSVPRTPQHNGIAKRKNRTLIEAARTMLTDLLLPILFWDEAVNTACYVQNRVLVTKPQNKTPYELLHGKTPSIGFMRPFGCHVTILNTLDSLGKFDEKVDKGLLVGYSVSIKAFRTMNYQPVTAGNQFNLSAGVQEQFDVEKAREEIVQQYVLFLVWSSGYTNSKNTNGDATFDEKEPEFKERKHESEVNVSLSSSAQAKKHDDKNKREAKGMSPVKSLTRYRNLSVEFEDFSDNSINEDNSTGTLVPAIGQISTNSTNTFSAAGPSNAAASPTHGKSLYVDSSQLPDNPNMPELEDITYSDDEDDVSAEANFTNLETTITVSPIPTTRVHKDHPVT
nr:hypothetical protein [Tanacetum cinerariifolium]